MLGTSTPQPCNATVLRRAALIVVAFLLLGMPTLGKPAMADDASTPTTEQMREWIEAMKTAPRGPFERIRWFCEDGTVLPPKPYACGDHGGGIQHGEWNERTQTIRAQGYPLATLLAELEPSDYLGSDGQHEALRHILIERFLVRADDGWVFRRARYYRGAIQVEDEIHQARALLLDLAGDPWWRDPNRFLLLREATRLLPVDGDHPAASRARDLAIEIAEADPAFQDLRIKLHGMPDAGDIQRVTEYARHNDDPALDGPLATLGRALDALYAPQAAVDRLRALGARSSDNALRDSLLEAADRLEQSETLTARLTTTGQLAHQVRQRIEAPASSPEQKLHLLQASLALEQEAFAVASHLFERNDTDPATRHEQLTWLRALGESLYGTGLLSARQWQHLSAAIDGLLDTPAVPAPRYAAELAYLARTPGWAQRALGFHFDRAIDRWAELTPLARHFIPDRLRDSPLLFFSRLLDGLRDDAGRLTDTRHILFGDPLATGLRALNPGLRRGVLRTAPADGKPFDPEDIYLLPETTASLPPVAGILTLGAGNSLSHVQLLARNLGIPNVVVDEKLIDRIQGHVGEPVVLAASPGGRVELAADGPEWQAVLGRREHESDQRIEPDWNKLDLNETDLRALHGLRADDSGRQIGPKAANLGELAHHYPEQVSAGLTIPFGVFRELIERPMRPGGPTAFEWLQQQYERLRQIEDAQARNAATAETLARMRDWIATAELPAGFRGRLRGRLTETFGSADTAGVFVRSDTNVEDLPGFTGAGLNRTVANVVGFEAIIDAIREVWASPFTERAYAWRQAYMDAPAHVYPAVLLQATVPVDRSGVLVTSDLDTGDRQWLSIAASEGLGGAVDGQAAEELRVHRESGAVRLLNQATAPTRLAARPAGGIQRVAAEGPATLLSQTDIDRLRALADDVETRGLLPVDDEGNRPVADIEFGFVDDRLALFQIRPLVENRRARADEYLITLDRPLRRSDAGAVDLSGPPRR
ncbi:PEP/pyruvate-binding domain-containing protein [Guyparkeria halopsychrophila]|uniref:PEP/pyruvate-binding domain-containing protein n=1 Tax=Guyparkeria halopsychrophila TaxID=3139421 RepID=UPI0037C9E5F5